MAIARGNIPFVWFQDSTIHTFVKELTLSPVNSAALHVRTELEYKRCVTEICCHT